MTVTFTIAGEPYYAQRVSRQSEADFAECRECGEIITPNQYWQLRNSVGLHHSGSCSGPHRTPHYWRWL